MVIAKHGEYRLVSQQIGYRPRRLLSYETIDTAFGFKTVHIGNRPLTIFVFVQFERVIPQRKNCVCCGQPDLFEKLAGQADAGPPLYGGTEIQGQGCGSRRDQQRPAEKTNEDTQPARQTLFAPLLIGKRLKRVR